MKASKEFLSGTLSTLILALLKENKEMYGYEICQSTKEMSDGYITLTEGAIYPALHKLEKKGLVVSSKQLVNGRTRKYYRINVKSQSLIDEKILLLNTFSEHLQKILKPAL